MQSRSLLTCSRLEAHVAFHPERGGTEQEQTFKDSHGKEVGNVQYSQLVFCFKNNLSYRISVTATKPFLEVKQPCWWAEGVVGQGGAEGRRLGKSL